MKKIITPFNWHAGPEDRESYSIGDDLLLLDNPAITSQFSYPVKLDVVVAIICIKGSMKGSLNLKPYSANAPCLFIILAEQILQSDYFSDDFSGLFIVMSKRFLESLKVSSQIGIPLFLSVHDNPWIPLNEEDLESMIEYYTLLQKMVRRKENPNRIEIARHLTLAFFYGTGYHYHKITESEKKSSQNILVEEFLSFTQTNYKMQRRLEFYADKLCLTPKYLSKVIKETSGKSANSWINDYVTLEAKALLKSTNMTIQQISDELNFPSQSFFGKYFKRFVGVSPKEYRNT
jgi:AraC-like DNA-binding protein